MAGLFGLEPMPRTRALLNLRAVPSVKIVLGDRIAASLTSRMPAASIVSRVTAVTLTGTFWRSSRFLLRGHRDRWHLEAEDVILGGRRDRAGRHGRLAG